MTWGDSCSGGHVGKATAARLSSGVLNVVAGCGSFAALKEDGSVATWGWKSNRGIARTVASQLSSGVHKVIAAGWAFAAIAENGSVVTWGDPDWGGASNSVDCRLRIILKYSSACDLEILFGC